MELVKPISSDHDLIALAKKLDIHLDHIYESNAIKSALPMKGSFLILLHKPNQDVGHWTAVHDHEYYDSMGEGPPACYDIGKYNEIQTQSTHGPYCDRKTIAYVAGSGAKVHLHPESHEKALKTKKAGRGVRLHITKHEIKKGYKKAQGGFIWTDAAIPALATSVGVPEAAAPVRAGLKSLTGIGVDDYDSDDEEGGRVSFADVSRHTGNSLRYAKRRGLITDAIDETEKLLHTKATRPEHRESIGSVPKGIKHRFGVGVKRKVSSRRALLKLRLTWPSFVLYGKESTEALSQCSLEVFDVLRKNASFFIIYVSCEVGS
ncbi:hypothetical protein ON010_g7130 [Phytophthora cinnamomi]|nr:hypothetical protein ON010_g7130 [Phytophthora cinnamomi]